MATLKPARVFIVDDHPLVREWLANLVKLQPNLIVCGQAADAGAALAAMAKEPPDVAIVDLSLKTGSGLELIKDLRAVHPDVAVIVLSVHEDVFYAERAMRAGARGYVMKSESTGRIIEAIREVQAGRIYANPEVLGHLAERLVGSETDALVGIRSLSDRELEVFRRLGRGQPTRQIASALHLSIKTVQAYCVRIKDKLGLPNRAQLVRQAVCWVEKENSAERPM